MGVDLEIFFKQINFEIPVFLVNLAVGVEHFLVAERTDQHGLGALLDVLVAEHDVAHVVQPYKPLVHVAAVHVDVHLAVQERDLEALLSPVRKLEVIHYGHHDQTARVSPTLD